MPRYLVERTFPDGCTLPVQPGPARLAFLEKNALDGVTWIYSYVAPNWKKSYCIVDAPTPEAVRRAALSNGLPVDRITEVLKLDPSTLAPYSYRTDG